MVDRYVITKNIAKHGKNSIIVIPSILNSELQPRTTVKVTIEVIKRPDHDALKESIDGLDADKGADDR